MAGASVEKRIKDHLKRWETLENIKILWAVESGSRAWRFASPDSDYDVRFIYVRPTEWYLSTQKRKDVLEQMTDPNLDLVGWDLTKTLGLLNKSNPSLVEWLVSPIVYSENASFIDEMRSLMVEVYSLKSGLNHYRSMAESNWKTYFQGDEVSYKKYLYVLRPIFCCRWMEKRGNLPPVIFEYIRTPVKGPAEVEAAIEDLIRRKMELPEIGTGPRIPVLDDFITAELDRLREVFLPDKPRIDPERLDQIFRKWVAIAWPLRGSNPKKSG